jgi:homoserine/homoserine lactone efflux protein
MSSGTFFTYVATVALVVFTPGPSTMLAAATASQHSLRAVALLIAGDLSANLLQMTLATAGVTALVTRTGLLQLLKWAGVAYLAWLALHRLRQPPATQITGTEPPAYANLWARGFFTSLANPKALLFFAALFPPFLDPSRPLAVQVGILALAWIAIDGTSCLIYATVAGQLVRAYPRRASLLAAAGLLVAAGLLATKDIAKPPEGGVGEQSLVRDVHSAGR